MLCFIKLELTEKYKVEQCICYWFRTGWKKDILSLYMAESEELDVPELFFDLEFFKTLRIEVSKIF